MELDFSKLNKLSFLDFVEVEEKEEGLFVMVEYTMETDGALLNEYQIRIAATKKASD